MDLDQLNKRLESLCINLTPARNRLPPEFGSRTPGAFGERRSATPESSRSGSSTNPKTPPRFSIFVFDRLKCLYCINEMNRGLSLACGTCTLWPICRECVVDHHLGACTSFKLMPIFQKRCVLYEAYLRHTGEPCYQIISTIRKRLESSLAEAGCLSRVTACNNDPILRDIIDRKYIGQVNEYRQLYVQASETYDSFASIVSNMNRFANTSLSIPENFSPLETLILGDEKLERLRDMFEYLLGQDQTRQMNEALKRLENLIRLMTNTNVSANLENGRTPSGEKEVKRALARSKSFNGNKK